MVPYGLLVLAIGLAFGNLTGNGFTGDDQVLIVGNNYLRSWEAFGRIVTHSALSGSGETGDLYRPLQIIINLIIYQMAGLDPLPFHILSVGLHAANACLLYALGRKLDFGAAPALLAALLWGLHPVNAESVMHISGVADPLALFFCLLGLLLVLPDFTRRKILIVCPVFLLALLSKESAVMFPLLVAATIFLIQGRFAMAAYARSWPLWLMACVYIVLRLTVLDFQSAEENFSTLNPAGHAYATHFMWRLYTCLATVPFYLQDLVWPVGLHFEIYFPLYQSPWRPAVALGAFLVLLAFAYILWARTRRGQPLRWGLLWFGIALAPYTGLIIPTTFLFSEHWLYVPSAGIFLALAETVARINVRRHLRLAGVAAGFVLAFFAGGLTWQLNRVWHDGFTLYSYMLDFGEPLPRPHVNLAEIYMRQGDLDRSLAELRIANRLLDTIPTVHQDIAYVLMHKPDWKTHVPEAIDELKIALKLRPDYRAAYQGLAYIYGQLGDSTQAAFYLAKIREIQQ